MASGSHTDRNMAGSLLFGNCLGHPFCHPAGGLEMSWGAHLSCIHSGGGVGLRGEGFRLGVHLWPPLVGSKLEARTKLKEPVSHQSSSGDLGPIVTQVIAWMHRLLVDIAGGILRSLVS